MRVPYLVNTSVNTANGNMAWYIDKPQTNAHIAFFYIECVCNAWFTFEILVSEEETNHLFIVYMGMYIDRN